MRNNKMKTITILAAACSAMLILTACGGSNGSNAADNGSETGHTVLLQEEGSTSAETGTEAPATATQVPETTIGAVEQAPESIAAATGLSMEEAKQIALEHAGVAADAAAFIKEKKEHDDGIEEYDITFTAENTKYEYEIAVSDGTVLQFSQEAVSGGNIGSATDIGLEEAKQAAFAAAGVSEADAVLSKAGSEYDDGVPVYEIEFVAGNMEYDYTIHAENGTILESDVEQVNH